MLFSDGSTVFLSYQDPDYLSCSVNNEKCDVAHKEGRGKKINGFFMTAELRMGFVPFHQYMLFLILVFLLSISLALSLYFTWKIPGEVSSLDAVCYPTVQSTFRGDSTRDKKKPPLRL